MFGCCGLCLAQMCPFDRGRVCVDICSEVDGVDVMSCGVCAAMSF